MRAVVYLRVSTDEQAVSGLGLDVQQARCREAIAARGWELVEVVTDAGVSGKIAPTRRPGLARALELLCPPAGGRRRRGSQADVLVVAKLDRLTRTTRDLLDVLDEAERCGFGLVALDSDVDTTTASGRLVATMLGGVAEWERRVIAERTRAALAVKRAQGARLGRPVITPAVIRVRVAELRADGLSLAAIASALNDEGHRTSVGTEWTKAGVQRLLRSQSLDEAAAGAASAGTAPPR